MPTAWNPLCMRYFNPHSPCGERLCKTACIFASGSISIHTPHAGSDVHCQFRRCYSERFQSTLPMRGATHLLHLLFRQIPFQSTLPMRGATRMVTSMDSVWKDFNPHSPCGERRKLSEITVYCGNISIHTPHAGSDPPDAGRLCMRNISIHTPHAGSDWNQWKNMSEDMNFNPHSPCGERRRYLW